MNRLAPIGRLFMRDINIDDLQEFQELVYDSCTECGRCSMVCPMGINIARGVNVMREALSEADLAPLELMAVAQEQAGRGTVFGVGPTELAGILETLRGQGISIPLDKPQADVLLVTTVIDVLLFQDAYSRIWRTKRLLASSGCSSSTSSTARTAVVS